MPNETLKHALHSLAHPLSLLMIAVLIINDHILKHTMPSWWTGKLSDVAGLAFAPLLVAVFLALIIPAKFPNQKTIVFWIAFIFVGGIFTLVKSLPSFNQIFRDALYIITGKQSGIVLDPTDLLTLPALLVAYWLWHKRPNFQPSRSMTALVLTLAVMGVIASDQEPYDSGADCLQKSNHTVKVRVHETYISQDGGLTWENSYPNTTNWDNVKCWVRLAKTSSPSAPAGEGERTFTTDDNPQFVANFTHDAIQISMDGGTTWQTEYSLEEIWSKRLPYHWENPPFNGFSVGPRDAIYDEQTGNFIVAMGYQGILVREANSNWQWVGIGRYDYTNMVTYEEYDYQKDIEFQQQLINAVSKCLLVLSILILIINVVVIGKLPPFFKVGNISFNILALVILLISLIVAEIFLFLTAYLAIPMAITLIVVVVIILNKQFKLYPLWRVYLTHLLLSIVTLASFILPYYLWYSDILTGLTTTNFIAFGNTVVAIFLTRFIFQRYIQSVVLSK